MHKGLILPVIVLGIFGAIIYYLFINYGKTPYPSTSQAARSIPKYPNAASWEIKDRRNFCFLTNDECSQPTIISFRTKDEWAQIYHYYLNNLTLSNWQTKSTIITSIPSSIGFSNNQNCKANLNVPWGILNFKLNELHHYTFTISCYQNPNL